MELKEFLEGIVMVQELYPDLLRRPSVEELKLRYDHDITVLNLKTQLLREEQNRLREKESVDIVLKQKLLEQVTKEFANENEISAIERIKKLKELSKEGKSNV